MKDVFKDLGTPTLIHDKCGTILFVNGAYQNLIGFSPNVVTIRGFLTVLAG
jgi:PAS domain-containing protein